MKRPAERYGSNRTGHDVIGAARVFARGGSVDVVDAAWLPGGMANWSKNLRPGFSRCDIPSIQKSS